MPYTNAIALISRIRDKINRFIVKELENHQIEGIVPSHGDIVANLFSGEQYTMQELAVLIGRTKPTVTVLVDKLVDYGFVVKEKCAADNRVTYIQLTPKGMALKPGFDAISQKLNRLIYSELSAEDAERFEQTLVKINQGLDKRL